jgi:aminopeptidase N
VRFHYAQEKPHANYLLTLVAGYFKKLEDKHGGVPLAFYTPPSSFGEAAGSFHGTRDMMEFFEKETGVAYPWPKYDQVCVNDFVAGGMENTSATTLTDSTLFSAETENIESSEGLVAHELAHQWFGDLVTCKDWSHLWLNEGFATYYETLYTLHAHGRDDMLYELYTRSRMLVGMENDVTPIVRRAYNHPDAMFDHLAYPKGGWVLHMLRSQVGEDTYRQCIKTYLERHRHQNVVTEDLRAVFEEVSGRSFDQFFDQWLYHAHHPELVIRYSWDEPSRLAKISVRQTQKLGPTVLLFDVPLPVRLTGPFGITNQMLVVNRDQEDFYIALPTAPKLVRIDPDLTLLAKVNFEPSKPMLESQLDDKLDVVGRLLAIEQFAKQKDKATVEKLGDVLRHDPFYGVRVEASKALKTIHTDEALQALLAAVEQPDARVRRQVFDDISDFYRETAFEKALAAVGAEKNPEILAIIVGGLSGYGKAEVKEVLLKLLNSPSYRNRLAEAAIRGIRLQDDPAYVASLVEALRTNGAAFTSRGFGQGLMTLGYLGRNEPDKTEVREFIATYINDRRDPVQNAAIRAFGELEDERALAMLNKFASGGKENATKRAADEAIEKIRAARKPADDFKNLRQEVTDLRKANADLRKDLDDLKAKFEARSKIASETDAKQKPKARAKGKKS